MAILSGSRIGSWIATDSSETANMAHDCATRSSGSLDFWCCALVVKVLDRIEMDVHTTSQIKFLADIDFERTVCIQYRKDLENHPWFAQHGWQLPVVPEHFKNKTQAGYIKENLLDHLDPVRRERIRDYYHQDYDLIRTAQPI